MTCTLAKINLEIARETEKWETESIKRLKPYRNCNQTCFNKGDTNLMEFFVACMHVSASSADEEAEVASMQTTYNGIHMQDDYLYIYFALLSTNMHDNPDTKTDKQP